MVTASRSLRKRQELRQHLEEVQRKLQDRRKSTSSLLRLIDQRDELNEKIGEVSQSIIDLGEAKEFVRELIGVSQRDFNAILKTAKESSPSVNASPREDESHTGDSERQDDDEAASALSGAGSDGDHEKGGQ